MLTSLGPFVWPDPNASTNAVTSNAMTAAAHKVAFRIQTPKGGTLGKVKFRLGTTTTGDTLKISFQDVDPATGDPDGVVDQFRTLVVADADDNVWVTTGLITSDGTDSGTKRTVARGESLFIVIEFNARVAGSLGIFSATQTQEPIQNTAYVDVFAASWTKGSDIFCGVLYYDDDSTEYSPSILPCRAVTLSALASNTTPDEVALKFSVPVAMSVCGASFIADHDGDLEAVLYAADGTTVLASAAFDKDIRSSTAARWGTFFFASDVELAANTTYYLALKPTSTSAITVVAGEVSVAGDMAALPGGTALIYSQRTDGGAWADTNTRRPRIHLLINKVHDGSGDRKSVV